MKPLNCKATDKCQINISETPGYKELLRDITKGSIKYFTLRHTVHAPH